MILEIIILLVILAITKIQNNKRKEVRRIRD